MKALENFDRYDEKISTSAWLFTIAKNHLTNHWRDTRPAQTLPETNEDGGEDKKWQILAIEAFKKADLSREVDDYLAKLTEEEREIVTFHYLFGYSYTEIAEMMYKTEGAVKVAAHRAIKKMNI